MTSVQVFINGAGSTLECRSLDGEERLGEFFRFDVTAFSPEPVNPADVVGQPCLLRIETGHGHRRIHGIVSRVAAIGTSHDTNARRYRLTIRPHFASLELTQRRRVFRHLSVPQIIESVLKTAGFDAERIRFAVAGSYAPREYVVQYGEPDTAFIRRLCGDEGLYFRLEPAEENDVFVLEDRSSNASDPLAGPVTLVDETGLLAATHAGFGCTGRHGRRVGKVTLRDYSPEKPAVALEGVAEGGEALEKGVEVYSAPGRFTDASAGKARASLLLESLRADAHRFTFHTTAAPLFPGASFTMEISPDYHGVARPEGKHFVVAIRHAWSAEASERHDILVEAIPLDVPFRLPAGATRPHIAGAQSAIVTGAPGEEIHPTANGRVHVRFHWDRSGPTDQHSSLPVRVSQPNMPGSMLIPRVGWEVLVAFEDGDPDRPYVLGRAYNAKQPPPFSLPKNKTVTSFATNSSPGGAKTNMIFFDDGAGRQHLSIQASFGKSTTVANDLFTQVASVEACHVKGSQSRTIGASENVSVKQALQVSVGSQAASVGGVQKIFVKGNLTVGVGSESVLVGGLLAEKVGNPVAGAANLANAAILQGAGALGTAGALFAQAAPIAKAAGEGAKHGGLAGAAKAAGQGVLGLAAGHVPGGDVAMAAVTSPAAPALWEEKKEAPGDAAAGGGAGAAMSDASGAAGPGPGHRNTNVKGTMLELVGALHAIVSPGPVNWQTTGASTFLVGGSHSTKTAAASLKVLGGSVETVGSLRINSAGVLSRDVKGALSTTIGGGLSSSAGGKTVISAKGNLTLKVGGSLTLDGSHVTFVCGSSVVSASPGGVLIKAGTVTIDKPSKQSSGATHS